jgi:two-component system, NtrC family, response regulator AlgB
MSRVLIVDDDKHILRTLQILLEEDGHEVHAAASAEDALSMLTREPVDIALVDLQLPGMSGADLLRELRDHYRNIESVIITAHGSVATAVEVMKEGAFDYLSKPFTPEQVRHRVEQIERVRRLEVEVAGLRQRIESAPGQREFLTSNAQMLHLLEIVRGVASSDVTVLIAGESGTGKTMLARILHETSSRSQGPFVPVDCSTFQESLLESELFGHKRGSFTGAANDKPGKVEAASGGTLFLDEVGEVPLHLQGKLLRLVDDKVFERIGETAARSVDARIVAATNRDLEQMVSQGEFRQDLFFRLSVVDLTLPALRHRPEDILPLARRFMTEFSQTHQKRVTGWDVEVEAALIGYSWPGNVRELSHALQRAVLMAPGRMLRTSHFPDRILAPSSARPLAANEITSLGLIEEREIRRALTLNLSLEETAAKLGIAPATLWRKRKKYGL